MSHISELHEPIENIPESAKEYFSDELKQRMKKFLSDALDDEFQKADDYCNEFLTELAASRAEDFLKRVLNGRGVTLSEPTSGRLVCAICERKAKTERTTR